MDLRIAFLYPELMNIYGDRGNILALSRRAQWRGIDVQVDKVTIGNEIDPSYYDFFFFGGGQDKQQIAVSQDLKGRKGDALKEAVENGAVVLSVCGGYQLLGKYYRPFDSDDLPGIGQKRKRLLIERFGSVSAIKQASAQDLINVLGRKVGQGLYEELHP